MSKSGLACLLACVLVGAGCASNHPSPSRETGTIRLADAVMLDRLVTADAEVTMTDVLRPSERPAVYFGQIDHTDVEGEAIVATEPILATRDDRRWNAVRIADERMPNGTWMYVGAGPANGEAWAVLDADPELAGASLIVLLLHSRDAGATWTTIAIQKPSPLAMFDSFGMAPHRGRLTVYQPAGHPGAGAGYYHYTTTDGGTTWMRSANFEPDAMIPADPVPESEQPEIVPGAVQRADMR